MTAKVQKEIEDLFTLRRHGVVDAMSLKYEVFGNEPLRKIKVISGGKYLPVEFYSINALLQSLQKIVNMAQIKDAKINTLRSIFKVADAVDGDVSLLIRPVEAFETTYYRFTNKAGFSCVVVRRPSNDLFYQRLSVPALLSYVLSNQVGFLIVPDPVDGVYTTPDKQIEFSLVGESLQILNDFSTE